MTTEVVVRTVFDATHKWPDSSNFLKYEHHHQLHIEVKVPTKTDDSSRSIEFFQLRSYIHDWINTITPARPDMPYIRVLGNLSMEQLCLLLHSYLERNHSIHCSSISFFEDNYGGAVVTF